MLSLSFIAGSQSRSSPWSCRRMSSGSSVRKRTRPSKRSFLGRRSIRRVGSGLSIRPRSAGPAARAGVPGLRRADLDRAVEEERVQVLPAVRGCIYLVPRVHAALALRVAEEPHTTRLERELEKAGSSMKEVEAAGKAIVKA